MRLRLSSNLRASATLLVVSFTLSCGGSAGDASTGQSSTPTGPSPTPTVPTAPVVTHPAGTLGPRYPMVNAPQRLAVTDSGTVLATMQYDRAVARFPIAAPATAMKSIQAQGFELDIAVNRAGTLAYAASDGQRIDVLDLVAGTVKTTLPISTNPYYIALSPDESRLFVTTAAASVLSLPTTSSGSPAISVKMPPGGTWNIALSPTGRMLYVAGVNYQLWRLDPSTLAILAENKAVGYEMGAMLVSPDEKELYVVVDSGELWILDATTLARIAYVPVGQGSLGMAMSPDGAQLYVTAWSGHLTIVDRVARTVVKTIQLGGTPQDVKFDKLGTTAIVANGNGWVDVIN